LFNILLFFDLTSLFKFKNNSDCYGLVSTVSYQAISVALKVYKIYVGIVECGGFTMSEENEKDENLSRMVNLLRSGAIMLHESCPVCHSPLFKVRDEIVCPKCQKRVVFVRKDEEASKVLEESVLSTLEGTLVVKIQDLEKEISKERDPDRLYNLLRILVAFLEALERIKRIESR